MSLIDFTKLIHSVTYFLCYQERIGRGYMVDESSLKYPVADYLAGLEMSSDKIRLEYQHPNLLRRLIDLVIVNIDEKVETGFEFKIAKNVTNSIAEKQRFFNDLMRLYLVRKSHGAECYFIVVGSHIDFIQRFRSIVKDKPVPKTKGLSMAFPDPQGFFSEWLAFTPKEKRTFIVKETLSLEHQPFYLQFLADYKSKGDGYKLELPEQITTTCIEITPLLRVSPTPYVGGIWKVE